MSPLRRLIVAAAQIALLLLTALSTPVPSVAQGDHVGVATLKGIINPVSASYLERAISEAEDTGAKAIVIQLDTPGGLDSSMRSIIQKIMSSKVPVIVYVAPNGARDGSAGVYITYAAHIAAMAPSTNIGSAHPVAMGESGTEQQMSDTMTAKVTNDAVAYIRSLAAARGRNADWAEKAVRESVNITAQEALDQKVIDVVANDLPSLLQQLDGKQVQTASGTTVLATKGVPITEIPMSPIEAFLLTISDPTIAYILLSLGTLGLIFELSNPGAILPGVVGGICLLFALFGLGTLSINLAGLMLIAFAFLLFTADIFAPTHGVLTTGGIASFALGSMMLVNTRDAPYLAISTSAIVTVTVGLAAFFIFALGAVVRARRRRPVTGQQGLVGQIGRTKTELDPDGTIFVDGALWHAVSEVGKLPEGEAVEVLEVRGLTLVVRSAGGQLAQSSG